MPAPRPLTEQEKAALAEMERLRPLSDAVRQVLQSVGGDGFDLGALKRLPPWDGFVVDTGANATTAEEGGGAGGGGGGGGGNGGGGGTLAIRSINLNGMRLRGTLPESLFALSADTGERAEELDEMSARSLLRLTTLAVGNNRLEGRIPRGLLRSLAPAELRFLELNDNSLVGKIPTEVGAFQNLLELKLQCVWCWCWLLLLVVVRCGVDVAVGWCCRGALLLLRWLWQLRCTPLHAISIDRSPPTTHHPVHHRHRHAPTHPPITRNQVQQAHRAGAVGGGAAGAAAAVAARAQLAVGPASGGAGRSVAAAYRGVPQQPPHRRACA